MTITSQNKNYTTITTDGAETIDTIGILNDRMGLARSKHFVTSFKGSGTLEVSDNGTDWIDTGIAQDTQCELSNSLQRFVRISGAGEKVVQLITF